MFNIVHLQSIAFKGDAHMKEFLVTWDGILSGMRKHPTSEEKEQIFYDKIQGSTAISFGRIS